MITIYKTEEAARRVRDDHNDCVGEVFKGPTGSEEDEDESIGWVVLPASLKNLDAFEDRLCEEQGFNLYIVPDEAWFTEDAV